MMKKILIGTLAAIITVLSTLSVAAAGITSDGDNDTANTTVIATRAPSYSVTIPAAAAAGGEADVQCINNDTEYNKAVYVRISGLDASNRLVFDRVDDSGNPLTGNLADSTTTTLQMTDAKSQTKAVKNNDIIACFANGNTTNLVGSAVKIGKVTSGTAGKYKSNLNFVVSYETNPDAVNYTDEKYFEINGSNEFIIKSEYLYGGAKASELPADLVLPPSVGSKKYTAIGNMANPSITSVVIPSGVTSIKTAAFEYSSKLKNVVIPSTVTAIGERAFNGCSSLVYLEINKTANSITGAPWGASGISVSWIG